MEAKYLQYELQIYSSDADFIKDYKDVILDMLALANEYVEDGYISSARTLLDQIEKEIAKTSERNAQGEQRYLLWIKKKLEVNAKELLISIEEQNIWLLMILGILGTGGGLWMSLDGFWRRRKIERKELGLDNVKTSKKRKKTLSKFILICL